jgi:hypothetical protein
MDTGMCVMDGQTMGRGMPRPPSYEKLSRQCATQHPKQ